MPPPSSFAYQPPENRLTPEAIVSAYDRAFGRAPSEQDIAAHLGDRRGYAGFVDTIVTSPENQQNRRVTPGDLAGLNRPPAPTPTATPSDLAPPAFARPDAGAVGGNYTGFDWNNDYDLDKSAKGTFLYASGSGVNDDRWKRKETAVAWFDQYMRPAFEAKGYKVGQVIGDKAFVHTRENPEGTWIDWVENIDSADPNKPPKLAWQDESYSGTGARLTTPAASSYQSSRGPYQVPDPIYNDDGTVSIRVSPEEYARLNGGVAPTSPRRTRVADMIPGVDAPAAEVI
jgi:hypothetical protein